MSKRRASRDLMSDLLSEKRPPLGKQAPPPLPEPKPAIVAPAPKQTESERKVKMTLSLPNTMMDRLTKFETEMRLHSGERGHALAKSAIITKALELLFDEYDADGMACRLAQHMDPNRPNPT